MQQQRNKGFFMALAIVKLPNTEENRQGKEKPQNIHIQGVIIKRLEAIIENMEQFIRTIKFLRIKGPANKNKSIGTGEENTT